MNATPSGLRRSDAPRYKPTMSRANALRCPSCEEHFQLEDYDTEKGVLSCSHCKALLTLGLKPGARRGAFAPREEAPMPREIKLLKTKEGIELRRAWFQPAFVLVAMFCLVWDGFFVYFFVRMFAEDAFSASALFMTGHVSVGGILTYWTLANLFNSTIITVDRRTVRVRHRPFPWPGATFKRDDIEQLYVKAKQRGGEDGPYVSYSVWVVLSSKRARELLRGLSEADVALFIEQSIERVLDLKDRSVPGELER
jgi:hypothetical protein